MALDGFVAGNDFGAPQWLNRLRVTATDLVRARDWPGLHASTADLRRDADFWVDLWGPYCAAAARRVGDPNARALLDEVVGKGFSQPELLEGELAAAFGAEPDWPELEERIAANAPPPPLELLDWPTVTPNPPLVLFRLPAEREAALRERIPAPADTAWDTARQVLRWVSDRWVHANGHMEVDDAVLCLDRVDAGERYACVEYSLVLSQALNALGIPSRRLDLRRDNYHAGLGRAHMTSEAWIDELGRWVVLDGQNGLYWTDDAGTPLGAVELQAMREAGAPCPSAVAQHADLDLDLWYSYFRWVGTTGGTWSATGFVPIFQGRRLIVTPRLAHDPGAFYPDLSEVGVGTGIVAGRPALRLHTAHPYATGFRVGQLDLAMEEPVWVLDTQPGVHDVDVAVRTRYGALRSLRLRYRVTGG